MQPTNTTISAQGKKLVCRVCGVPPLARAPCSTTALTPKAGGASVLSICRSARFGTCSIVGSALDSAVLTVFERRLAKASDHGAATIAGQPS